MDTPKRRTVLAGAAGAAAALVTGCGDDSEPAAPPASDGPTGAAVANTADIPVGGGIVLADSKVVFTQPKADKFAAFSAVCTHQGCIVADVANGTINCGCHGSKYSITNGAVVNGPATKPLAEKEVVVAGDEITVA
jgi:Rieske Fe-S protein